MFQSLRVSARIPARLEFLYNWSNLKLMNRLNVLRALISETNNAAKTSSPIQTDIQLLSLIRKRLNATKDAAKEFEAAERPDLKEKEDAQAVVLEEYAGQVKTMPIAEITEVVVNEINAMSNAGSKPNQGAILKALFANGGPLDGKPVDRREVADEVKKALS
ncbi:hypothetical protein PENARI_c023G08649 [Penicillium arizonense]|uniref:Altered inheritance of mitochondria protein 41 n=1 Tax=Penicillium arizonense TaxID=1835702 RepID=A0A1F5L769_PENAI|nr:hypothetical protein PENARI_c023G08649 [Penicillium arizonense]OGE49078.1 hypothetical protein PENARI_c023G08649 [Penicillium arizonense]